MTLLYELPDFSAFVQSDVDTATATVLRDLVTGLVEDAAGRSYSAPDAVVPAAIRAVAMTAAARAYTNPNGLSSETVGSYSYSRASEGATGGVYLTPDERKAVRRAAAPRAGLTTLSMSRQGATDRYVEATLPGLPAPVPGSDASWPVPWEVDPS